MSSIRLDLPGLAAVAGLLLLGQGCAGVEATASKHFAQQYSCPAERVVISQMHGRPYLPPAPPEIASDPERLAIYEHRNETYYAARGCNEQAFYNCYRPVATEAAWQCDVILPPGSGSREGAGNGSPTMQLLHGNPPPLPPPT